jgi:predicted metal-dependent HD superfamily phosphohydrolase
MNFFNQSRWNALCAAAGVGPPLLHCFDEISRRYSEAHRAYHNRRHIDECLGEFDLVRSEVSNPVAVEFAIWFHDVIYDPRANDNEEQSGRFAVERLQGINKDLARQVADLILITKTHRAGPVPGAELLIDIDLSILGKPAERFAEFENGIRAEYAWVPVKVYCEKRVEILRGFLKRERIYSTKTIHDRYEAIARKNISKLIAELEAPI